MARKKIKFATVPMWAIDLDTRNRHTIAAAFELAGLTGQWVRLTSDVQRAIFGFVMWGKQEIRCTVNGISGYRTTCFGTDFETISLSWKEVEQYMAKQTKPI